jgi:3-oxocholest-4-en-26-oyl-CoA dehydrogenase beta subunit
MVDFALSEEHVAVRDLAAQVLADGGGWEALAQAGLLGVALPETAGGAGLGFLAAHLVLEQVGLHASPVPYWPTVVLGALPIAASGTDEQRAALLPGVVAGERQLTAIVGEPIRARREGSAWLLDGVATAVPNAAVADTILVAASSDDDDAGVWLVDATRAEVRPQRVISGDSWAEVALTDTPAEPLGGAPDRATVTRLELTAAAGAASMQAGLCAAALRLASEHTSRREQFGRPIASFQAVGQRLADAFIDTSAVQLTALQAAWRLDAGLPAATEVAIASWWAAEAGHRVLHAALHVHGGLGVDRDYPLHRFFLLSKQLEFTLGGATAHLRTIGAALAAGPA